MTESKEKIERKRESKHENTSITLPDNSISLNKRQKWSKQQYKEVIWAYHYAIKTENENITSGTYTIWRARNPNIFPGMNEKNLSNQRRFILKENKLTEAEIAEIISDVTFRIQEREDDDPTRQERLEKQDVDTVTSIISEVPDAEEIADMENKIIIKLQEIKKQEIEERKFLNKIKNIKQVSKNIEVANKVLTKLTADKNMNITEINEVIYATAAVIANEKIIKRENKTQEKHKLERKNSKSD